MTWPRHITQLTYRRISACLVKKDDESVQVWCEWIEMELRHKEYDEALKAFVLSLRHLVQIRHAAPSRWHGKQQARKKLLPSRKTRLVLFVLSFC